MNRRFILYFALVSIFIVSIFLLLSDKINLKKNSKELFNESDIINPDEIKISLDSIRSKLNDVAKNVASPVEIAAFIKNLDIPFSTKYLLDQEIDIYNMDSEQAIALGGFGIDLMYINFFGKSRQMIVPLENIRRLSQSLYISKFFNFKQLKELSLDNLTPEKLKRIKFITTYNLNSMEDYLLESDRAKIGVFMIIGAWTEGIYFLTQVAYEYPGEQIYERVAEQKFFVEELWKILNIFNAYDDIQLVMDNMTNLRRALMKIEFKYENLGDPWKTYDINGNEAYYQWQKSIAIIDETVIKDIIVQTEEFRNNLFSLKLFRQG